MFLTLMFLFPSLPPPSPKSIKNISSGEEFFFKWEPKKKETWQLKYLSVVCLFCFVKITDQKSDSDFWPSQLRFCLRYKWFLWLVRTLTVLSDVFLYWALMSGSLELPRVWNGSICVDLRGAPHQGLRACVWESWGISAIFVGAVVLGEHTWHVTHISSLELWSWWVQICQHHLFNHLHSWLLDLNMVKCYSSASGSLWSPSFIAHRPLLAISAGRDMGYHQLVCWPNFYLSCYHYHPKLLFPIFF